MALEGQKLYCTLTAGCVTVGSEIILWLQVCHCRVRDYALTARCGTGGSEIILHVVHGSGCRVWHCAGAEYEYILYFLGIWQWL